MYYERTIEKQIKNMLFKGKVIVIYGPRQAGKTTLAKHIISEHQEISKYFLCELPETKSALESQSIEDILVMFGDKKLIVLDEAQVVKDIGRVLKILVDTHPDIQIIATGSSSFELSNKVVEPLTGRKFEFMLYPLSAQEIIAHEGEFSFKNKINQLMIYGSYPGIYTSAEDMEKLLLKELSSSYLFKDILAYQDIRNSEILIKLLQMLALQMGSEVSYSELATKLGIDHATVQKYIDLLEKIFVVYKLLPFSRNLRKELNKTRKIYFYDLGIRNALINNFNSLDLRQDTGALWESFCIIERIKKQRNNEVYANFYFWRTWEKQEIDFIEEGDGRIDGYEIKWSNKKIPKPPKAWTDTYQDATYTVVNKENINRFIT